MGNTTGESEFTDISALIDGLLYAGVTTHSLTLNGSELLGCDGVAITTKGT